MIKYKMSLSCFTTVLFFFSLRNNSIAMTFVCCIFHYYIIDSRLIFFHSYVYAMITRLYNDSRFIFLSKETVPNSYP